MTSCRNFVGALMLASMIVILDAASQEFDYFKEFDYDNFRPNDFQKFYGRIDDGKITADQLNQMCENRPLGFTVEAKNVALETSGALLTYNVSNQMGSVDGRAFRSTYFNASLGEWTGAVFKPMCPGLYAFSLDFTAQVSADSAEDVLMHLLLRRRDGDLPGKTVATAIKTSPPSRSGGHTSVALILGTGDEVSTLVQSSDPATQAHLELARLSIYKINHLPELIRDVDVDARSQELKALEAGSE